MLENLNIYCEQLSPCANIREIGTMFTGYRHTCIVQVGAGGTGGYVAAELMRFIGSQPKPVKDHIWYSIIDGDVFETKNLGRQLCTEEDIGLNKAECLVSNYAPYYGIESDHIKAVTHYITKISDIQEALSIDKIKVKFEGHLQYNDINDYAVIVIDCVDRNMPRNIIYDYISGLNIGCNNNAISVCYLVASGNGKFSGQVSWGRQYIKKYSRGVHGLDAETIDAVVKKFPNMNPFKKATEEELSCFYELRNLHEAIKRANNEPHARFTQNWAASECTPIISMTPTQNNSYENIKIRKCPTYYNLLGYLGTYADVPLPYVRFPELLDLAADEEEDNMSCADRALINVQSIFANKSAACFIINYVTSIIGQFYPVDTSEPTPIQSVTSYFDCAANKYSSVPVSVELLVANHE